MLCVYKQPADKTTSHSHFITEHHRARRRCESLHRRFEQPGDGKGRPIEDFKAKPLLTCTLINVSTCASDLLTTCRLLSGTAGIIYTVEWLDIDDDK